MNWLKGAGGAVLTAILAFLAAMAVADARRQKAAAQKWKDKAVNDAEADVEGHIVSAKASLSQAKLHGAKAKAAEEKARKKLDSIGKQNDDMATIVSGWRSSRVRNNSDS